MGFTVWFRIWVLTALGLVAVKGFGVLSFEAFRLEGLRFQGLGF